MKENDSSKSDDKIDEVLDDGEKTRSKENENLCRARWRFGSFTFLNLVSSAAIIFGIGSAVLFARVYYDQRLSGKVVSDGARPKETPVEVPTTINGWEGDIAAKSVDQLISNGEEAASEALSAKFTDTPGRRPKHEFLTEREQEKTARSYGTPIEQTRDTVIDKAEERQADRGATKVKESSGFSAAEEQPAHARERPEGKSDDKREEKNYTEQPAVDKVETKLPTVKTSEDQLSQKPLQKQSTTTQFGSEKLQTPEIEVELGEAADTAGQADSAARPQDWQERKRESVDAVLQRATNISDVEDMYQWVLDDAEIVGIEKVLSALENGTDPVRKMELAKACLLDRLSVLQETEPNVERALESLAKLARHVNSTLDEKMFAHRKMAEKRLRQGIYHLAISHMRSLVDLDPKDVDNWIELGTYHLYAGEVDEARKSLETALEKEPTNGLATLNLGSLQMLSASQGYPVTTPFEKIAEMLAYGLNNTEPSLHESRHYAQLYDALLRSNRESQALEFMKQGVNEEILLSEYQLCQSYISGHATKPLWTPSEVTYNFDEISQLVKNFTNTYGHKIEDLPTHPENPFLVQSGSVEFLELFVEGEHLPICESSEEMVALCDLAKAVIGNCSFCDSFVLKMSNDASYWKQSGITNLGLRTIWILSQSGNNASLTVDVGDKSHRIDKQHFAIFDHSYVNRLRANSTDGKSTYWLFAAESWHPNVDEATKESIRRERF